MGLPGSITAYAPYPNVITSSINGLTVSFAVDEREANVPFVITI